MGKYITYYVSNLSNLISSNSTFIAPYSPYRQTICRINHIQYAKLKKSRDGPGSALWGQPGNLKLRWVCLVEKICLKLPPKGPNSGACTHVIRKVVPQCRSIKGKAERNLFN